MFSPQEHLDVLSSVNRADSRSDRVYLASHSTLVYKGLCSSSVKAQEREGLLVQETGTCGPLGQGHSLAVRDSAVKSEGPGETVSTVEPALEPSRKSEPRWYQDLGEEDGPPRTLWLLLPGGIRKGA